MTAPVVELDALARRFGEAAAVREAERDVSYAALAESVAARARALSAAGLEPGARVALACGADVATIVDALALLSLGCAILPVSSAAPASDTDRLAALFGAAWCLGGAPVAGPRRRSVESREIARAPAPEPAGARKPAPESAIVLALPSSGSTGPPKMILKSAAQVRAAIEIYARSVALVPGDRVLAVVPFEHSYGFVNVLCGTIACGGTLILPGTTHPRAVAEAARRGGASLLPGAPLFFDLMTKFEGAHAAPLGLRAAISVGTVLSRRARDEFAAAFRVPLWQSYGASEAGPVALNAAETVDGEMMALGRPCDGVEVAVLDESGAPVGDGEEGEIVVRSPAIALGCSRAGRFFTGDLGCLHGGVLAFRGRLKLLIAAAGRKVDPHEVEEVLRGHEAIDDAAVVAELGPDGRETVKAIVVARAPLGVLDVTDFCARRLAPHKVPRVVEFRASLPRGALGKLLRDQL